MIYDNDGPIYSSLNGKPPNVLLYGCSGSNCVQSLGNLCNLNFRSNCAYNMGDCVEGGNDVLMVGQNESDTVNPPPAALVCCSDIAVIFGFSQAFLDEQTWNSPWCEGYDHGSGGTCGYLPVNDYNRCQYLMYQYGPTESGDYCDRLELYINGQYSSTNLITDCV